MDNSKITIQAYNNNAVRYEEKFRDYQIYKDKLAEFTDKYIYKFSKILDIGCGPGHNSKQIYDGTHKIKGIDLSSEMVKLAKENAPECEFEVKDLREIGEGETYDVVIASFCIVHLTNEETEQFFKTISKILNKNGTLYLSFMEGKTPGLETTSFSDDKIYFNYFEKSKIRKLLSDNLILTIEILTEDYKEDDGGVTEDVFIYARKI